MRELEICPHECNWCGAEPCVISTDMPSEEHLCRCAACKLEDDAEMARLYPPEDRKKTS